MAGSIAKQGCPRLLGPLDGVHRERGGREAHSDAQAEFPEFRAAYAAPEAAEADSQCNSDAGLQNAPSRFCHFFCQTEAA
jgi:hypothetical protein